MRDHSESGASILDAVPSMKEIVDAIRHHHERWDGKGYPDGLQGDAIPLESRILAVADTYDAITTARPYSEARSPKEAIEEIRRCSGTQFDPAVVDAFLRAVESEDISSGQAWLTRQPSAHGMLSAPESSV